MWLSVLVILILSIIGFLFVMTLPSIELDTTHTTPSNTGNPDAATKQMELVITASGRGQPPRLYYPYRHENPKRQKIPPYSMSIGHNAPKGDKKKAQIAEGEFLHQN